MRGAVKNLVSAVQEAPGRLAAGGLRLVHHGNCECARCEDPFLAAPGPGAGGPGVRDCEGRQASGPARAARAAGIEAPPGPARRQVQDPRRLHRAAVGRGDRRLRRPSAVRVLLDPHLLLWSVASSRRLPKGARSLILDAVNEVLYSAASVWEVAIKSALRRRGFKANPTVLVRALAQSGYSESPVTAAHAARVAGLPAILRDPFDRLLMAQSLAESRIGAARCRSRPERCGGWRGKSFAGSPATAFGGSSSPTIRRIRDTSRPWPSSSALPNGAAGCRCSSPVSRRPLECGHGRPPHHGAAPESAAGPRVALGRARDGHGTRCPPRTRSPPPCSPAAARLGRCEPRAGGGSHHIPKDEPEGPGILWLAGGGARRDRPRRPQAPRPVDLAGSDLRSPDLAPGAKSQPQGPWLNVNGLCPWDDTVKSRDADAQRGPSADTGRRVSYARGSAAAVWRQSPERWKRKPSITTIPAAG